MFAHINMKVCTEDFVELILILNLNKNQKVITFLEKKNMPKMGKRVN